MSHPAFPAPTEALRRRRAPRQRPRDRPYGKHRTGQRAYDTANRLIQAVDAYGYATRYEYDTLDRLTQITDALGGFTRFAYDAKSNLLTVTDPKGAVIETNAYDLRNRLTQRTDALGRSEGYGYDGMGNLLSRTDKKGQATQIAYDALNRPSRIAYADGRTTEFVYDLAGNVTQVIDSVSGEARYAYDSLNRLVSETTDRGVISYQYDAIGRLTERRINGDDPTTYVYDKANRIKTITYRGKSVAYVYDPAGRLISRTLPNGITQTYAWNEVNEVTGISYKKTDGTVIESVTYAYDALGNPIRRSRSGTASKQETGFTATYDASNRMLTYNGLPLTYDANGNLIQRQTPSGTVTYTWDAKNQLTNISGPNGTASFKYDHAGRRIEKTINGVTTTYLYDGSQAIAELQGSAIGTTYLTGLQIDEVLAIYSNKGNRTLLTDALGSILSLTDDQQATKTRYAYSPYGETQAAGEASDNALQYTGRENDGTGLYYYRARYYDPEGKRFISFDPIGLEGGVNEYLYVDGNPISFTDPEGLFGLPGAIAGAATSIAMQIAICQKLGGDVGTCIKCINIVDVGISAAQGAFFPTWLGNVGKGIVQYRRTQQVLTAVGGPAMGKMAGRAIANDVRGAAAGTIAGTGTKAVLPSSQIGCDDECARYRLGPAAMGFATSLF